MMLCQVCKKQEADHFFMGDWNGDLIVTGLCSDCLEMVVHRATAAGFGEMVRKTIGWYPGKEQPRADGTIPFPEQAGPDLLAIQHRNELLYKLRAAVEREDYHEAAQLRDAIQDIVRKEDCHGS